MTTPIKDGKGYVLAAAEDGAPAPTLLGAIEFPGTDNWTTVEEITAVVYKAGGGTMDVRLFDLTNGKVVAALPGIAFAAPTIVSFGKPLPANIPQSPAIFEVQANTNGAGFARVHSVSLHP